jgi:hypothetical protein
VLIANQLAIQPLAPLPLVARSSRVSCCTSRSARRLTRSSLHCRRRFRAGETQRWRVNTTRSFGVGAHRGCNAADGIVGTKGEHKRDVLENHFSCHLSIYWKRKKSIVNESIDTSQRETRALMKCSLTYQTLPAFL